MKRPFEWTLKVGRQYQSSQTGLVHYFPGEEEHKAIPLYENFCFALALFRSRLSEPVQEGMQILGRLLHFQKEDGAFPVYLDEYPDVRDAHASFRILPVLFHIEREFSHVLGAPLLASLREALRRIGVYSKSFSYLPAATLAKVQAFLGQEISVPTSFASSLELSEFLIALQMKGERDLSFLAPFWDPQLAAYVGSQARELFFQNEPALTLFDLQMGELFGSFSARAHRLSPVHFSAALVYPFESSPPEIEGKKVHLIVDSGKVTLLWGNRERLHSLVTPFSDLRAEQEGEKITLFYKLPTEPPEDGPKQLELSLFVDHHLDHSLAVEGEKATTFQLGERVILRSEPFSWELVFRLHEGRGRFFGHLMRGNRPGQIGCRGEEKYAAYDWQIALRTVERGDAVISVELTKI